MKQSLTSLEALSNGCCPVLTSCLSQVLEMGLKPSLLTCAACPHYLCFKNKEKIKLYSFEALLFSAKLLSPFPYHCYILTSWSLYFTHLRLWHMAHCLPLHPKPPSNWMTSPWTWTTHPTTWLLTSLTSLTPVVSPKQLYNVPSTWIYYGPVILLLS